MHCRPEVKGLQAAPFSVAIAKLIFHLVEDFLIGSDPLSFDQGPALLNHLSDFLAARDLAHTGVSCVVGDDDEISREVWSRCAAEVQQH